MQLLDAGKARSSQKKSILRHGMFVKHMVDQKVQTKIYIWADHLGTTKDELRHSMHGHFGAENVDQPPHEQAILDSRGSQCSCRAVAKDSSGTTEIKAG